MAKISNKIAYPGANPIEGEDYLIGTDANSSPIELQTKTFLISDLKSFIIDDLFDGVAYRLPVFTAAAEGEDSERIVPSIVKQDVAQISGTSILGTTITIDNNAGGGSLVVTDAFTPFGLSTFEGDVILKKTNTLVGDAELYLLGKIYDANSNLGNNEQVLVSDGLGNVTWQNFQGSGLEFQSAWDARKISEGGVTDGGNPDLQNIQLIPGNTGKYWVVSQAGSASLQGQAGPITQWSPGDWAIVSEDDSGNVFWDKIDNSSVDGAGTENHIAMWTSAKTLGNAAPVSMIQDPDPNVSTLTFSGGERVVFDTAIELQQEVYDNGANAGTLNDILVSDSSSQLSYQNLSTIHVGSAEKLTQQVIFREAVTIGDPVYIVGYNNGQSLTEVEKADASDVNKMAAIGLAKETKAANTIGDIVISGDFPDIDTSSYSVGDSLYVAVGGGLTSTKPIVPNLIQKIAIVSRSNANNGDIEVFAVGRTNDVPNLTEGRIFVGSAANTIESDTVFLDESLHSATIGANTNSASADFSIAMGSGTSATEVAATAMGTGTEASGASSVAMGNSSTAIGDYSFVVGLSSSATAQNAVAIGESNTASSPNAVAIGDNNSISTQQGGIAIGSQNTVNGGNAFALGLQVTATGNTSLATGYQTAAVGNYSISSGLSTETRGQQSIAGGIGSVVRVNSDNSIAFGNKAIAGLGITDYKENAAFGYETLAGGSFGSFAMGWRSFNVGSEGLASGHASFVSGHGSGALGEGSSVTDVAAGVLNTSSGVNITQFQLVNVVGGANIQAGDTIYNNGSGSQDWTESLDFRINTIVSATLNATTPAGDVYTITVNAPGFKTNQGETVSIVRTINATEGSFAIGAHSITLGDRSTSIGYFAKAESDQSVAIGEHAWTKNEGSVAIGYYAVDDAAEQVAIGGRTVRLNAYGSGTITGAVAANLAVDANGKIIETASGVVDGSGTADYISKWQDANTLTDSIIYEDPNNPYIGISTNNPSYPLDVVGDNAIAINGTAIAHQSSASVPGAPNVSGIIQLGDVDGGANVLGLMDDTSTEVVRIQNDSAASASKVIFYDTVRAEFGDSISGNGAQGQIYSDGTNFRIAEIGGGNLYLQGSEVIINDTTTGLQYFHGTNGSTVKLYGNDPLAGSTIQLETASTGVTINNVLTLSAYGTTTPITGTVVANLGVDATGKVIETDPSVDGSGTVNFVPKWTPDGNTLGDSIIFEDPANPFIGINATPNYPLDVDGDNAIAINNVAIAHQSSGAPTGAPNASGIIQLGGVDAGAMALGLMDDTATEVVRIQTDSNNVGEVIFYDTVRAQFGDSITGNGAQGEIYSDGSNFRIAEIGGGNLYLQGAEIIISDTATGYQYFHGTNGTTVKLYGNDPLAGSTIQLETASTGVTINNDLTLSSYGGGQKGGTVAYNLAVDSNGKVIETTDGGGTVTGTGTTTKLPIWTDGPAGELGDSGLTQDNAGLTFTIGGLDSILGNAGNLSLAGQITTGASTPGVSSFSDAVNVGTRLDAGTNAAAGALTLDVKQKAYVRAGLVVSEFPGGVTVDNTAIVVGAGNNDIVSGSDHCIAVGNGNQIENNSDNSAVFGQGNTINEADACLVAGLTNTITGTTGVTERSAVVGFNNSLQGYASAVYGGSSTVVVDNNAFVLGFDHDVNAASSDSVFVFGEQNSFTSATNAANVFMIGADIVGNDGTMVLGYRNDNTQYPAEDNINGLGETKFVVSVGSNNTFESNALLITEGGINKSNTPQIPRVIMPSVTNFEFDDDPDATANAIPQGGLYHKQGNLYINTGSSTITRGTWTPSLGGIYTSNFSFTPTVQGGEFKRIEDMMFCYFTLSGTATYTSSSSGYILLTGLPAGYITTTTPFQELISGTIKVASGLSAMIQGFSNGPGNTSLGMQIVSGTNTAPMLTTNQGIQSGVAFSIRGGFSYIAV